MAVTAQNAVAKYYALPTINMAAITTDLVNRGVATLIGGERAIAIDGVQQTPAAAKLLGVPFADGVLGLLV